MNNEKGWVSFKDGYPKERILCEVRTNSKDRHPRVGHYEEGFKGFYDTNNDKIEGSEWRPLQGRTPVSQEPAMIAYSKDRVPENADVDAFNSNEYYTTFITTDGQRFVYPKTKTEMTSPWQ